MISCIILSAGESLRFGTPKALADINGKLAINFILENLLLTNIDEIIIVLGASSDLISTHVFNHKKVKIVYNKNYKFGQTSSLQKGISCCNPKAQGILMLPVDCPFVLTETYRQLITSFQKSKPDIQVPCFKGKRGHPPIFNTDLSKEILSLSTDQGINSLFSKYPPSLIELNDPNILKTFNTPDELKQLIK